MRKGWGGCLLLWLLWLPAARALDLGLPTANDAVLHPGQEAAFFQPTIEGTVESGMFGCVRRDGRRFHEGIDIKCLQRDRRGEPIDPVLAAAAGRVAFINTKPGLSNYGRYVILEHRWDSVAVCTLYAHLSEVLPGLAVGQAVAKGQRLGTLGHSTNTRERIASERAHLHFEINFLLNPRFDPWYRKRDPKAPPFGNFNGQNLIGLNPAAVLRDVAANPRLNFADYVARQPIGFTILAPAASLPWAELHPEQIRGAIPPSAVAARDERGGSAREKPESPPRSAPAATVAYEVGLTAWGLPVALWPRTAEQVGGRRLPAVNRVNEAELARWTCRHLVERSGKSWRLSERGREWVEILTYRP